MSKISKKVLKMVKLTCLCLLTCLVLSGVAYSQKTQTQVIKSTSPQEDSKSNSDSVPEVITQTTEFARIVIVRLKFRTDLLQGLNEAVSREKIRNGVILSGLGSVRGYHVHAVSNRDFPSHNSYTKDPTHPADIISLNGMVLDGRLHIHLTLADDEKAFGGHLELGTEVFTFAIVTIGVFPEDADLSRYDDKTLR